MADTQDTIARNGTGAGSIATADPLESEIMEAPAPAPTAEIDPPSAEIEAESLAADATTEAPEVTASDSGSESGSESTEGAPEVTDAAVAAPAGAPDVTPVFLSELSVAMMEVVGRERDRVGAIVDADATAHLAQARERAAEEEAAFRQVADEDVASIEAWSDTEVERIRADAAQRIENRRSDLDASLAQHEAVLQGEIEGIETAVTDYGTTLDGFLEDLRAGGDPARIAAQAGSLPRPPDLAEVRALSRTAALTRIAEAAMAADVPAADEATDDGLAAVDELAPAAAAEPVDAVTEPAVEEAVAEAATPISEDPQALDEIGLIGDTEDEPVTPTAADAVLARIAEAAGVDAPALSKTSDPDLAEVDESAPLVGVFDASASVDEPVAVMDPDASERTGWETEPLVEAVPVSVPVTTATAVVSGEKPAEASVAPGHPNAAVRLIRSVAPWTAPTHRDSENGDQGSAQS